MPGWPLAELLVPGWRLATPVVVLATGGLRFEVKLGFCMALASRGVGSLIGWLVTGWTLAEAAAVCVVIG